MKKIFLYNEIKKIDKNKVIKSLNFNNFVILRNLFNPTEVKAVVKNIKKNFNPNKDKIRKTKDYDLIKSNYQRFMFGMSGGVNGVLKTNPRYWSLINQFKKITNVGVLVNTSFNVRGEPIVNNSEDAFKCFMNTEMDYLVIENFLYSKGDNTGTYEKIEFNKD